MKIEFVRGVFRASGDDLDPAVMKKAGWLWLPSQRVATTTQISRVAPWVNNCVDEALKRVKPFVDKRRAEIAASVAATADIVIPVGSHAKALGLDFYGYQKAGVVYARAKHKSLNGDVRRLGKMIQGIGLCNTYPVGELKHVLVMCPSNAKITWVERWRQWSIHHPALSVDYVRGGYNPQTDFLAVNWEQVSRHQRYLMSVPWDIVIGDELHRISTTTSAVAKATFGEDGRTGIPARLHWLGLTGNPYGTRPRNIWPIVKFMDPADLGSNKWRFLARYCDSGSHDQWQANGSSNMEELQWKLRKNFMIRRTKAEVSDELPPRREVVLLPKEGLSKLIARERSAMAMALDEFKARVAAGASEDRAALYDEGLDDTNGTPSAQLALAALPMMIDWINEVLESEPKIVLACHHRAVAFALRDAFPDCAFVVGGIGDTKRETERVRFQTDPRCRVFVGNIAACCENMDLSASDVIVFCERTWRTWMIEQMQDRIWFVGKNKPLWVAHLVVEDSADSEMAKILDENQDAIERGSDAKRLEGVPIFNERPAELPKLESATTLSVPDDQIPF